MMKIYIVFLLICLFIIYVSSIMLKKECPQDELHRSCSFYSEYTCWSNEERRARVRVSPVRLLHCKAGCFCKECPQDDHQRTCYFYSGYNCWTNEKIIKRVSVSLVNCNAGCFGKKSFVRAYSGGPCITASQCRDKNLVHFLQNLPKESLMIGTY